MGITGVGRRSVVKAARRLRHLRVIGLDGDGAILSQTPLRPGSIEEKEDTVVLPPCSQPGVEEYVTGGIVNGDDVNRFSSFDDSAQCDGDNEAGEVGNDIDIVNSVDQAGRGDDGKAGELECDVTDSDIVGLYTEVEARDYSVADEVDNSEIVNRVSRVYNRIGNGGDSFAAGVVEVGIEDRFVRDDDGLILTGDVRGLAGVESSRPGGSGCSTVLEAPRRSVRNVRVPVRFRRSPVPERRRSRVDLLSDDDSTSPPTDADSAHEGGRLVEPGWGVGFEGTCGSFDELLLRAERMSPRSCGAMDRVCPHCLALYFDLEVTSGKVFNSCCYQGAIPVLLPPPRSPC